MTYFLEDYDVYLEQKNDENNDKNNDENDDENNEDNDTYIDDRKLTGKYKFFERTIDSFFEFCDSKNILCRRDFSCCNTCGNSDIIGEKNVVETSTGKKYEGYVYYHVQETDTILDSTTSDLTDILVHLGWSIFRYYDEDNDDNEDNNISDEDYNKFGEKMVELANEFNNKSESKETNMFVNLEYDPAVNIKQKLELTVKIPTTISNMIPLAQASA